MRGLALDRILTGTALALVLTLAGQAYATSDASQRVEAAVPVPDLSGFPPPTAADIAKSAPSVAPAAPKAAPTTVATTPPAAAPSPRPEVAPAPDGVDVKALSGRDLVKAPLAVNLSSFDATVAERVRDLLAAKGDRYFGRRGEKAAVEAFYRDRGFAPVWLRDGAPSARGTSATAYLRGVDADGLEPSEYPAPQANPSDADAQADAELKYTATMLTFVRHAELGRVHWSRVSGDISYPHDATAPAAVLDTVIKARTVAEALDGYLPQHASYKALKAKLAEVRKRTGEPEKVVRMPEGPTLKPGMTDTRVAALRERLKVAAGSNPEVFDESVTEAVRAFQKSAGLNADGVAGPGTIKALNGAPKRERTEDIILANLERWRWMPHDLGKTHVVLNIPDFRLRLIRDDKLYWTTKVVVGKPSQPTPITSASMKFITVNPTWNVPPSIIANEYIPALRADPGALDRIGLKVEQNPDGTIRIYQPPGDRNALGRIRFNFPNKFLVYQHDTPDKHLFAQVKRAYSHGCMRVENPLMYGEKLLSIVRPSEGYTAAKLQNMFGGSEINIDFPVHIPVHLTYQSAFVDDAGELQIRDDVYGRDARLIALLRGDERRMADLPVERSHTGSGVSRDALRYNVPGGASEFVNPFAALCAPRQETRPTPPRAVDRNGNRHGSRVTVRNEPSFFERMFR